MGEVQKSGSNLSLYHPGDDVGALENWPFDNPASQYRITRGDPKASGRLDAGGAGEATRFGIWRCTLGAFECIEQGDEMMTVLSGQGSLTDHASGTTRRLAPGDTLFIRDGSHVTWEIEEVLTKVFYGYRREGY